MFKEPIFLVFGKTFLAAVTAALLLAWVIPSELPLWIVLIANFCACLCLTVGGHFLERIHICYFEPKLIKHPVENRSVRLMIWILGGGVLIQLAILVWKLFGTANMSDVTFWLGGVLFALFQLAVTHPIMVLLKLNNFYNDKG